MPKKVITGSKVISNIKALCDWYIALQKESTLTVYTPPGYDLPVTVTSPVSRNLSF